MIRIKNQVDGYDLHNYLTYHNIAIVAYYPW